MLKELIEVFRGVDPEQEITDSFREMLSLAHAVVIEASDVFWREEDDPEGRTRLYREDIQINQLERAIRKQLILRAAASTGAMHTRALVLMSLIKDVERMGDYAKNLAELRELHPGPLPDDPHTRELGEIRRVVEAFFGEVAAVLEKGDVERARTLNEQGRDTTKRCDSLVRSVAATDYSAAEAVVVALAARYYKRLQSHLLNLVSSVLMPLHKLDFFDEDHVGNDR